MSNTIPKKALVALPDLNNPGNVAGFRIVPPELATVSAFDRSFQFGDSLYEVTRSYDGVLFSFEEHLERLATSAKLAHFETPLPLERIHQMTTAACRAYFQQYGNSDVYVRIVVSRGLGDLNIDRASASEPYTIVFVKEFKPWAEKSYLEGVHYAVVDRRRNLVNALDPAMKSGNYLNNILALSEAKRLGADDAILLNYQGFVTEGTTNNVYAVKNGEIWTAPLSIGILAGITRDWIFEICHNQKMPIQERLFTADELNSCQEMFLSSATKEVMPITKLNGRMVGDGKPGPVTTKLRKHFLDLIAQKTTELKHTSLYL